MPSKLVKDGKVQALRPKTYKNGQWEKATSLGIRPNGSRWIGAGRILTFTSGAALTTLT